MTKFFKRTFAFFVAVIMMISSFPYMALAEDTASATEGSTTDEMTNAELEKYIDSKINNASFTLPEEQFVATADKEYMSGIYTTASFSKYPETTVLDSNVGVKPQFGTTKLLYAVAIYTGQNDEIRFPVIVTKYSTNNKNTCYIRYVSIPQDVNNFEFGKDWERCNGELDLTYYKDDQRFSSKYDGDRISGSFKMNEKKFWRNYIKYTGSGDEEKYYETLPTSLDIGFQYVNTKVTGSLKFKHNAYVLNLNPYRIILENLKNDYTKIKTNQSLYTKKSLNNYYKAVRDVLDFDIKTSLSKLTLDSKIFSTEIADIATKVKTVVENYNSAKKSLVDLTAYNSAKEQCDTIINNQSENAEYEKNSFAEFKKIYVDVTAEVETVETQVALDKLTAQLIAAQTMLRKSQIKLTFKIYKNDSSTPYYDDGGEYSNYGVKHLFDISLDKTIDKTKECVKRWIIYSDGDKTRTVVGTTDSTFTLYATKDATVEAYVVPLGENAEPEKYSKVIFYGFNGRVIDVKYLKNGDKLEEKDYTSAPTVPFYKFKSWNKTSITGNGEDIIVRANYSADDNAQKCNVHYDKFQGRSKAYDYDQYVHLPDVQDGEYFALATTESGKNADGSDSILTYLNGREFHAPMVKDIYVVKVSAEARIAKVAVTGSYATKIDKDGNIASETDFAKKRAVFNCKFYLPEDCTPIEWGARITANNKTMAVKSNKNSKYNEYSIYMNVPKNSSITAFTAVAYVTYKDSKDNYITIESKVPVTQELN
ncbi:hypothetical protein [Eubacterium sp.]|uniref:hypothetical protein n=1 Tax=uncultured Eubacterium sp. TaxID=165185 RepID=UPI0025DA795A|nr:hypothetical protein [uncultured Eubacterium sp.]